MKHLTWAQVRAAKQRAALARAAKLTPTRRQEIARMGGYAKQRQLEQRLDAIALRDRRDEFFTHAQREWFRKASGQ